MRCSSPTAVAWGVALAAVLQAGGAQAFNVLSFDGRNTVKWRSSAFPIHYEVQDAFPAVSGDADEAAIAAAVSSWENVACADIDFAFDGYTTGSSLQARDDRNRIVYTTQGFRSTQSGAIGVTYTEFLGDAFGWYISGGDIAISAYTSWSTSPGPNAMDLQSVVVHELGHLIGLQHTPVLAATMYFATGPGDTTQRSLHEDDIAGACFLYPAGTFSCTSNADCPTLESNDTDGFGNPLIWGRATCQSDGTCAISGAPPGDPIGSTCAGPADCESSLCIPSPTVENNVCSQPCTEGDDTTCPTGFTCVTYPEELGDVCVALGDGAIGASCESGLDCASAVCIGLSEDDGVCTELCDPDVVDTCPAGSECLEGGEPGEGFCITGGDTGFGETCASSLECEGVVCLIFEADADEGLCTQYCNPNNPADACPDGSSCWPGAVEGEYFCVPGGDSPPGTPCESNLECDGALCVPYDDAESNFRCGQPCEFRPGVDDCDEGFECFPLEVDGVCLPKGDAPLGAPCETIFDCESLLCLADDDVCTELCTSTCPAGFECVALTGGLGGCVSDGTTPGTDGGGTGVPDGGGTGLPDGGGTGLPDGGGTLPDVGGDDDRPIYTPDGGTGGDDSSGTGGGGGVAPGSDGGGGLCAVAGSAPGPTVWLLALVVGWLCRRRRSPV